MQDMITHLQRLATLIFSGSAKGPLNRIATRYLPSLPVVGLLGLMTSLPEGVCIGLIVPLLATVMSGSIPVSAPGPLQAALRYAISFDPDQRLIAISPTLLGLIGLKTIVMMANATFAAWVERLIGDDIRRNISHKLLHTCDPLRRRFLCLSGPYARIACLHGLSFVNRVIDCADRALGAGKSTIFNLLCGLIEPTAGQISVEGIGLIDFDRADVATMRCARRVGYRSGGRRQHRLWQT